MTSLSGSIGKTLLLASVACCLMISVLNLRAVAQETPQYTQEEYDAYQAITKESDATKKVELITNFFKTYPKSTLKPNIVSDFELSLKTLEDAKKWSQVITVGRQFLNVVPDDAYVVTSVADGYFDTKNYQQFVIFGEEAYKTNPIGILAYRLASAYKELNNNTKVVEWAEKTVAKLPDNYEMYLELAIIYSDNARSADAEKNARQCLKLIQAAKKPEQMSEPAWTDYTNHAYMACYYIIGSGAYQRGDYINAVPNLENAIKYKLNSDLAYYSLGMSYWQLRKSDLAMRNLAKAYIMNGKSAAAAKLNLENLYKSAHNGSLVGLDKVLAAVKAEMGIK